VTAPAPDPAAAPPSYRLRELVAAHLGTTQDALTPGALLGEDLSVDSLAAIELAMVVEDAFGVTLEERELAGMHSYGDLEGSVLSQLAGR